jgi:hypothetical protein
MIEQMFSEAEYQVLMVALSGLQVTGRDARLLVSTMDKVQECLDMFEHARREAEQARLEAEKQKHEELQNLLAAEDKKAGRTRN